MLALGCGKVRFELELRTPTRTFLERLFAELAAHDVVEEVELTSSHQPLLSTIRALNPTIRAGFFVSPFPTWKPAQASQQHVLDYLTLLGANVAHLPPSLFTLDFVAQLREGGWGIHAANVNTEADFRSVKELGLDQFSTDRLGWALQELAMR